MKKPVVDYREFRLRRINEPQFAHLKYLLGWVGYFILFYLTETFIPAEKCHPVWCPLDDLIPFCEVVAMAIYIIYPTRQDLRPETFPRDNILTQVMGLIYSIDTNTGVCPSLHVAYSIGIASTWLKYKDASKPWKIFVVIAAVLICLSVAFVKQHSVVDIFAALPLCLLAEIITFGKSYWQPKLRRRAT